MQILSSRLESDRRIIRHLLEAAQYWKGVQTMMETEIELLQHLVSDPSMSQWWQGRRAFETRTEVQEEAKMAVMSLHSYVAVIRTDLVTETDFLIQRVTNLISIDESYRSRDANTSIRRLSWVTVSALLLVGYCPAVNEKVICS